MRLYYKNQCIEIVKLLEEAHDEIEKFIREGQKEEAVSLLEKCQQGAISVGTCVDREEGEGTEEVRQLELYCELTYRYHEDLLSGVTINCHQMLKKLHKPLVRVSNGIRNNLSTQTEVVFLPYKAAMWDSLESEWRKADADPDCTAFVIPIPYYDKNIDGSFAACHYEIDQYPPDVPVIKYENYDFAKRHPDKIYIHNPYDSGNHVTSVHPDFYSDKLNKYTDDLVYIPYFVLNEVDASNKKAVEGMEHFVTTVGVFNANHVIVQSEAMRQVYIDVLMKYSEPAMRPYWEEKISGAGSPKMDRVLNLREEDYVIPEQWKTLVERKDGSRKRIIFYNTGVSALLKRGEKIIDKIEYNFDIFKEAKDDVTLLWRPHPLIEATLVSMRPKLVMRYEKLKKRYLEEGWGIYDDTPEMYRAIAVSDAYYGDWSSIVWLYRQTGKPILIQNCNAYDQQKGCTNEI